MLSLFTVRRRLLAAALLIAASGGLQAHAQRRINTSFVQRDVDAAITDATDYYHVDRALVYAVVKAESDNNPWAVSRCGALGLMQLMPETAWRLGVHNPFNPRENVFAGTLYLKTLLEKYRNVDLALAAYNAGSGQVDIHRGIPPFRETIRYINRITYLYQTHRFVALQAVAEAIPATTLGEHKPTF